VLKIIKKLIIIELAHVLMRLTRVSRNYSLYEGKYEFALVYRNIFNNDTRLYLLALRDELRDKSQ
jgi:hypothetical protein